MALTFETTNEYYMDVMNVMYCEPHNALIIGDSDENKIMINGVKADEMIRLVRNMFCARDKVTNYVKDEAATKETLEEVYTYLTEYLNKKPSKKTSAKKDNVVVCDFE